MGERKLIILAIFAAGMAIPGIPFLALLWYVGLVGDAKAFLAIVGIAISAMFIGFVIRLVNRIGDPRRAKRPPNVP